MLHYSKDTLDSLALSQKISLINSITGVKPANLIGSQDANGQTNLAIFSSVVHLGSHPPLIGFVLRPKQVMALAQTATPKWVERHTYDNIIHTGVYTINHVSLPMVAAAHATAQRYPQTVSEFAACGLTPEYLPQFNAPFVVQSVCKFGLRFIEEIAIERNGTTLIVGEVEHILLADNALSPEGAVRLDTLNSVGLGGTNHYYSLKHQCECALES
ncbi:flavin reductase family protein [Thiomicrorhabdus aquaedulcis]|uniref:flavin reductase family protein n=1 Tax=Thiomicrorhabdus aquaedulcis TaxID=2211106 RepID=UPI000FD9BF1C|nr:flavin reductase [Thiomicrorhabdus aquaedulcis]